MHQWSIFSICGLLNTLHMSWLTFKTWESSILLIQFHSNIERGKWLISMENSTKSLHHCVLLQQGRIQNLLTNQWRAFKHSILLLLFELLVETLNRAIWGAHKCPCDDKNANTFKWHGPFKERCSWDRLRIPMYRYTRCPPVPDHPILIYRSHIPSPAAACCCCCCITASRINRQPTRGLGVFLFSLFKIWIFDGPWTHRERVLKSIPNNG